MRVTTQTGYTCKNCDKPSPAGVGYATSKPATGDVTTCPCGYSQKLTVGPTPTIQQNAV